MKHLQRALLLLLLPSPAFAAFSLVENFDTFGVGSLNNQDGGDLQNPWTANAQWSVVSAPAGGSGNAISGQAQASDGAAFRALNTAIDNANTASTLFFRLYRTGGVNMSAGLSDDAVPALFAGYEIQLNAQNNGTPNDSFKARDAGAFDDLGAGTFAVSTWYNVWMVVNNSTNFYELYMNQGDFGTAGTTQIHIPDPNQPGDFQFGFRNGGVNPLTTLIFAMGNAPLTGTMVVDDIYIDNSGQNLVNPVPEPSSALLVGAAATLGLASRRRNRRA